ncbi:MAG: tetratricopeptide repeat protein [SAR324 cluster bacterium]|nr:tetratricopeptide repeat protein [SAR324 cluster bacterium]
MRFSRLWEFILLVFIIFAAPLYAQETATITSIELQRVGKQLNVMLYFDSLPIYEIHDNLEQKVLLFKFKNTHLNIPNGETEHLYNDPILEGIRFIEEGQEIWAQFKSRDTSLAYNIGKNTRPGILKVELREKLEIDPLEPPPIPPNLQLKAIRFGKHPPDFSRVTFNFVHSKEPRMFFWQDKEQKITTIRFSDTHPVANLEKPEYEDNRIRFTKMETDANQTFITIDSTTGPLEIKEMYLLDPPRWVIDFFGEPKVESPEKTEEIAEVEEEMTEKQKERAKEAEKQARKERNARIRRKKAIKENYNFAESAFREGQDEDAINLFQATYKLANSGRAEFEDEMHPLAIQALFRKADILYKMLKSSNATNYHAAIDAYRTAIRIANEHNLESDLLPHAYLQIGQSYRNMQFFDDANQIFDDLQKNFSNTLEAAEANFWRAVGHVDRRDWQGAINSFREYLRAGASPKYLAAAHYKMSEAYYHLKQFTKAREGFERARTIDMQYPENDPALLFHMGEAYYESADLATAREVFNTLLQKYPDADFSKLVALRLGDFLREEGKEEEALEVYKQATTSFKPEVALLGKMRIANIYSQRPYSNDYQKALEVYNRIAELTTESPLKEEALLRKGLTLTLFGHYQPAIKALEEFTQKYPNNQYVQRAIIQENIDENLKGLLDQYYQQQDYLGLVGVYKDYKSKYLSRFRFDTTLFQVGDAYQKLGLFDDSIDVYKFLTNRAESPLKGLGLFQEALALSEKGDNEQAKQILMRFIVEYPNSLYNADANKQLAAVYKQGREYLEAIKVYEQTIRQYTEGKGKNLLRAEVVSELYYELGNLYNELGRYAEAEQAYSKVPEHYAHPIVGKIGTDVPFYIAASQFLKADMLFELKRDTEALEKYQGAMAMYAPNTHPDVVEQRHWAQYKIGIIYQRTGREQEALAIFQKLMEKEGNPLWKRLATENHNLLTRQLAYKDYLRN